MDSAKLFSIMTYTAMDTILEFLFVVLVNKRLTLLPFFVEHLSKSMALWPWNWMDSIEYIGYTWVILYFSFALIKFAMMDERQMIR